MSVEADTKRGWVVIIGGGFLVFFAGLIAGMAIKRDAAPAAQPVAVLSEPRPEERARPLPAPPPKAHHYDSRDGMAYGYTADISEAERRSGRVSGSVLMFNYAGQRDGKHQVHLYDGTRVVAAECSVPCEVIKVMSVMDMDGMRGMVNVEYLRNASGVIAGLALADAIAGRLEPYAEIQPDGRFEVWVDPQKGLRRTRIKS